jgi:RHS repeat-associated protein
MYGRGSPEFAVGATHESILLGLSVEKTGSNSTYYVRDDKGNLISERTPGGTYYYLLDGLGSVVGITNSSGNLVDSKAYKYDPFGKQLDGPTSVSNPWRFASGYLDSATGFLKFGTRYYSADLGRWTQQDPDSGQLVDPMTLNRYAFVGNDPVNQTDPSGMYATSTSYCDSTHCVLSAGDSSGLLRMLMEYYAKGIGYFLTTGKSAAGWAVYYCETWCPVIL